MAEAGANHRSSALSRSFAVSAGRHSRRTAVAGIPRYGRLRHAHPGAGMLTAASLSGHGRHSAAVTDGGGGADMRHAISAWVQAGPVSAMAILVQIRLICAVPLPR